MGCPLFTFRMAPGSAIGMYYKVMIYMIKKLLLFILPVFLSAKCWSQAANKRSLYFDIQPAKYKLHLQFYSPAIVRVTKWPDNRVTNTRSLSVIAAPANIAAAVIERKNEVQISTASLKIHIDRSTGRITFHKIATGQQLQEGERPTIFTPALSNDTTGFEIGQGFIIPYKDAIYGLGQHQEGVLNYRNHSVLLRQKNMDIAVPFLLTSSGFGIFWDNASSTLFKDENGVSSFRSSYGHAADYYIISGANADSVIVGMRLLTGHAPMFPKWVFGFWQSRERYKSQSEIVDVVKRYRALQVPLDGVVQDWQYWGEGDDVWNAVAFGNPRFPEPGKMVDSIHSLHSRIIISVWPNFGPKTSIYQALAAKNLLFNFKTWPESPGVKVYDAFNPAARDIYWSYIKKNLFNIGIDGWWLDATEPEQPDYGQSDLAKTYLGPFKEIRNAFPLATTAGVYEHQRAVNNNKRVFILTRSAYAGQQRYGTMTWSGDIQGRWDVLRDQIPAGLNLSLSGIPYWNTDIGGFFVWDKYKGGVNDPAFRELYTRWLEFAAFTPMFRSHGTNTPREIYQFGKRGDWAFDAQEKFINLRYRLQPYLYSLAWQVTAHSSPITRALVMDFPDDSLAVNLNNEYMFGKAFLVAPVTDSMYVHHRTGRPELDFADVKKQAVYLPQGVSWINFWDGKSYEGGKTIMVNAPIDEIPLFVKAGSIVPFGPQEQYTDEHRDSPLELRIYPGRDGRFTLYEDESDGYNYEKGQFSTISFSWTDATKTLSISKRKGSFPGMLRNRKFIIELAGQGSNTGLMANKICQTVNYYGNQLKIRCISPR